MQPSRILMPSLLETKHVSSIERQWFSQKKLEFKPTVRQILRTGQFLTFA